MTATDRGQIATITLWEAAEAIEPSKKLGADLKALRSELSRIAHAEKNRLAAAIAAGPPFPPPPKLVFEIGDNLLHAHVVALLDSGAQVGFTDIAIVPINKSMR